MRVIWALPTEFPVVGSLISHWDSVRFENQTSSRDLKPFAENLECTILKKLILKQESPRESKHMLPWAKCFALNPSKQFLCHSILRIYFFTLILHLLKIGFPGMLSVPTPMWEYICSLPIVIIIPIDFFLNLARHSWQVLLLHEADGWCSSRPSRVGCPDWPLSLLLKLLHLTSLSRNPATALQWHPAKSTALSKYCQPMIRHWYRWSSQSLAPTPAWLIKAAVTVTAAAKRQLCRSGQPQVSECTSVSQLLLISALAALVFHQLLSLS